MLHALQLQPEGFTRCWAGPACLPHPTCLLVVAGNHGSPDFASDLCAPTGTRPPQSPGFNFDLVTSPGIVQWVVAIYWACQTLTTVGCAAGGWAGLTSGGPKCPALLGKEERGGEAFRGQAPYLPGHPVLGGGATPCGVAAAPCVPRVQPQPLPCPTHDLPSIAGTATSWR